MCLSSCRTDLPANQAETSLASRFHPLECTPFAVTMSSHSNDGRTPSGDQFAAGSEHGARTDQEDPRFARLLHKVLTRIDALPPTQASQATRSNQEGDLVLLEAMRDLLSSEKIHAVDENSSFDPITNPSWDDDRMKEFMRVCTYEVFTSNAVFNNVGMWFLIRDLILYFDTQTALTLPEKTYERLELRLGRHILHVKEILRVDEFVPGEARKFSNFVASMAPSHTLPKETANRLSNIRPTPIHPVDLPPHSSAQTTAVTSAAVEGIDVTQNDSMILPAIHSEGDGRREETKEGTNVEHSQGVGGDDERQIIGPRESQIDGNVRPPSSLLLRNHGTRAEYERPRMNDDNDNRNGHHDDSSRRQQVLSGAPSPDDDGGDDDSDDGDSRRNFASGGRRNWNRSARRFGDGFRPRNAFIPPGVSSAFEKHYQSAKSQFSGVLTEQPSFPHWVVDFETLLESHGVTTDHAKVVLLKTAVSGMAEAFYSSDIRGDHAGRLAVEVAENHIPAKTLDEAVYRIELRFCNSVARSALYTTLTSKTFDAFLEEHDLDYVRGVEEFKQMILRYTLNGPEEYKSQQAMVDIFLRALPPATWTKSLIARVKAFRHNFTLTKFASHLTSLALAEADTNESFQLKKPSLTKKRFSSKIYHGKLMEGPSGHSAEEDPDYLHADEIENLHDPTARLFLNSAVQNGIFYSDDGPYTLTPRGHAVYFGDTRRNPRVGRTRGIPRHDRNARVRTAPTRYPSSLPLYRPPRPISTPSTQQFRPNPYTRFPALPSQQRSRPYTPAAQIGPCDSCGKYGHLWRSCPSKGSGSGLQQLTLPSTRQEPPSSLYSDEINHLREENAALAQAYYASQGTQPDPTGTVFDDAMMAEESEEVAADDVAAGREAFNNYLTAATMPTSSTPLFR